MTMVNSVLPLPSLLNEESFGRFSTRSEFITAMNRLVEVIKKMRLYGSAAQLGCSVTLMDRVCYDNVAFRDWLRLPNGSDATENDLRRYVRQVLSKVPRLEECYATFYENPDFDLSWKGRRLYVNSEKTLPAFVVAVCFNLPTLALGSEDFAQSCVQNPTISEMQGNDVIDRDVEVYSFANLAQVDSCDAYLQDLIKHAVVDEEGFNRVRAEMFPDLLFSKEVEEALARHHICFRSISVMTTLIRLQRAFTKMCSQNIDFEDAYGHVHSLAMNESATVRQKYPDTRRFTWEDGSRLCFPHVKIGNSFRVHFLPDKEMGKLYVGYMGQHLPL